MPERSAQDPRNIKQNRLALIIVVSIGFLLNVFVDDSRAGSGLALNELLLGVGLTLLYLILGFLDDRILDKMPLFWGQLLYLMAQSGLIFGIGWVLGSGGTWLIALPLVVWTVETVASVWRWPSVIVIGLVIVLPPGLHYSDWSTSLNSIPAFSAAILFVYIFTQMRLSEQKNRQKAELLSQELEVKNQQLAEYAAQVKELATTEERNRLARELHDSVTQSLYSLTLLAAGWRRLARTGELENVENSFTEVEEVAQQALKEMRLLIYELRPPVLETEGLLGALHHRLNAVEKRAGIEARLIADEVVDLSPEIEEALYAIAIEALNNALKHAAATSITLQFSGIDTHLVMEMVDDGVGFDLKAKEQHWGMGLENIRHRTDQIGGDLEIHTSPGEGTRLRVEVPKR
jgi:signal transduction histidine kinase